MSVDTWVILPDNDKPGRAHAESAARSLHGRAASLRILELRDLAEKGDVSDWIASGGTREGLELLANASPTWEPPTATAPAVASPMPEQAAQQTAADVPEPFKGLDLVALARDGIPEMPWILPGWLSQGDIALLAGAGGVGKSTTAAALGVALSKGEECCGLKPKKPYRVLVFDQEQGASETARLYIRLGGHGERARENLRVVSDEGLNLRDAESMARLEATIREFRPEVIILDSVQQCFGLGDENDAAEVGALYRELFRLRSTYGLTTLAIHHKKKSPRAMPPWRRPSLCAARRLS